MGDRIAFLALATLALASAPIACDARRSEDAGGLVASRASRARATAALVRAIGPFGARMARARPSEALPGSAAGAMLLRDLRDGATLSIADVDASHVVGERVDGAVVFPGAHGSDDVVAVADAGLFETIRLVRHEIRRLDWRSRLTLGAGLATVRLRGRKVEVVDARGAVRFECAPPFAIDARGVVRELDVHLERGGLDVVVSLDAVGLVAPIAVDPTWTTTGSMSEKRDTPTAARLAFGDVLVAGSFSGTSELATAELFHPASGSWSAASPLSLRRANHTLTLLGDGSVLAAAGDQSGASAETFDAAANKWTATAPMTTSGRTFHSATLLLPSGKVLVAGGEQATGLSAVEVYDPATRSWSSVSPMRSARTHHTATRLANGKVLVVGGELSEGNAWSTAELFDPATSTWSDVSAMSAKRTRHVAALLANGHVLVAGGGGAFTISSAEEFDPGTSMWTVVGSMHDSREAFTATTLASGPVLVTGGKQVDGTMTSSTELYDPGTRSFVAAPSLARARARHTATLLADDRVLVAGGYDYIANVDTFFSAAEIFSLGAAPADAGSDSAGDVGSDAPDAPDAPDAAVAPDAPDAAVATDAPREAAPPGPKAQGAPCSAATECSTGFCVDGVCCDTGCEGRCHSCVLPGNAGTCLAEPIGVDLRAECGAALSCTGTCGKDGACIGAGTGTQCAPPQCTGPSSGRGSVYCVATGATCEVAGAPTFDCAAFACEQATGTCRTVCTDSDQCAPGYICEVTSRRCVQPQGGDASGCAWVEGGATRSRAAAGAALLAVAMLVARRTRVRRRATRTGGRVERPRPA